MVDSSGKIHLNLARLKKAGHNFEIDVDSDKAIEFKGGANISIRDVLKVEKVFHDAKKGLLASEKAMEQTFGTSDPLEVAKVIIQKGEIQLTAEYRKKMKENKRKKILNIIHANAVDPKTGLPHPMVRLENAIEEARIKIDEFKSEEQQVEEIVKLLRPILPIKFEIREIAIRIGSKFAGKAYSVVKNFGKVKKDEWANDGSWMCVLEMPAGLQNDLMDKLNGLTHGTVDMKILNKK